MNAIAVISSAVLVTISGLACTHARAAIIDMTVNDSFFLNTTPGNLGFNTPDATINIGDTVRWTWLGGRDHSVTSVPDMLLFDSGIHGGGFVFTHTFNDAGDFDYICIIHGFHNPDTGQHGGMSGMITVVPTPTAALSLAAAALLASRRRR